MSTYRKIHGRSIQAVTTDPSETVAEGQVWYNTSSDTFKSVVSLEAFSSGSPLSTAREGAGGFGTQTAAVICGGETPSATGATEEYNGTGFSAGGTMNTARFRNAGAGTLTAGITFGGYPTPTGTATETYNGTAWTTSPYNLNTGRDSLAGAGTQTSALAFGGGPGYKNNSEEYDGEGWSATPTLNTSRISIMGSGANAEGCLAFGGATSSPPTTATNSTESWNGSSWTAVNSLNTARYGGYGAGTQTAAILAGGIVGPGTIQSAAETWDGTNWTTSPASLATARSRLSVAGSSTAAVAMAGTTPSITTATEEYNKSASVITAGAWSSANNQNTTAYGRTGCGTQTAGLVYGGYGPSTSHATTETYNGTSFTEVADMSTGRRYLAGFGTQTAAVAAGGNTPPGRTAVVEEWNGSSWGSNPNSLPAANSSLSGAGTATAGLVFAGNTGPGGATTVNTQTFDGTSFTEVNNLSTGRYGVRGAGIQTAALCTGGKTGPSSFYDLVESWDGTNWTAAAAFPSNIQRGAQSTASNTAALYAGGSVADASTAVIATSQLYNGTTWVSQPSMGTARSYLAGFGTSTAMVGCGGYGSGFPAPARNQAEEFTGVTETLNVKTLTQS